MLIQSNKVKNFSADQKDLKLWKEARNREEKEFMKWETQKEELHKTNNISQNTQQQQWQIKQNKDDNKQKR